MSRSATACFNGSPFSVGLLREMAEQHGCNVDTEVLLDHSLTHQNIADLTATARQTVSTVLSELQKQDQVYMERGRSLICDLSRLQ